MPDQPSSFRDQRQRRVAERLGRLVSPAAQAFFIDACRLMGTSSDLQEEYRGPGGWVGLSASRGLADKPEG